VQQDHPPFANLLIPISLFLTVWILLLLVARRNERKVRSEWEVLLRDAGERRTPEISETAFWQFCAFFRAIPPSWAIFSRRTTRPSKIEIPGSIRFVYVALFDCLPVRCWVCHKLILERNAKYRRDDVQHFLEEAGFPLSTEGSWFPRPYCSKCLKALGFEPYQGSKTILKHKL
jgi:hypothetical protein